MCIEPADVKLAGQFDVTVTSKNLHNSVVCVRACVRACVCVVSKSVSALVLHVVMTCDVYVYTLCVWYYM